MWQLFRELLEHSSISVECMEIELIHIEAYHMYWNLLAQSVPFPENP